MERPVSPRVLVVEDEEPIQRLVAAVLGAQGMQVVTAQVPQSELFSYATELRSMTAGRGSFRAELDHYEEVPQHVAEKVIADHKKEVEAGTPVPLRKSPASQLPATSAKVRSSWLASEGAARATTFPVSSAGNDSSV